MIAEILSRYLYRKLVAKTFSTKFLRIAQPHSSKRTAALPLDGKQSFHIFTRDTSWKRVVIGQELRKIPGIGKIGLIRVSNKQIKDSQIE